MHMNTFGFKFENTRLLPLGTMYMIRTFYIKILKKVVEMLKRKNRTLTSFFFFSGESSTRFNQFQFKPNNQCEWRTKYK